MFENDNRFSVVVSCTNCAECFEVYPKYFYDSSMDSNIELPVAKCPQCSSEKPLHKMPFLYWKRDTNILYIIIWFEHMNQFEWDLNAIEIMLAEHLESLSGSEQKLLSSTEKKYIDSRLFIEAQKNQNTEEIILGHGQVLFTPALDIEINTEYQYIGRHCDFGLSKNEIGWKSAGVGTLQKDIIELLKSRLHSQQYAIFVCEVNEKPRPVAIEGLTEIVLFVGCAIVIPVLVNVIGDVITDLRHNKSGQKLNDNDDLRIRIIEDGTKKNISLKVSLTLSLNILKIVRIRQ